MDSSAKEKITGKSEEEANDKEQQLAEEMRESEIEEIDRGESSSSSDMVKSKIINGDDKEQPQLSEKIRETEIEEIDDQQGYPPSSSNSKSKMTNDQDEAGIIQPHPQLPKPEAPQGLSKSQSSLSDKSFKMGKFIRQRSNNFSAAIGKTLYFLKENIDKDAWAETVVKVS